MNQETMDKIMYASVSLTCKNLTDRELAGLNLAMAMGRNPKTLPQYGKVESLFTQNNGTEMHNETLQAFYRVVIARLEKC